MTSNIDQVGASLPEHLEGQTNDQAHPHELTRTDEPAHRMFSIGAAYRWLAHPQKPVITITAEPEGVGLAAGIKVRMEGKSFDITMGVQEFLDGLNDGKIVPHKAEASAPAPEAPPAPTPEPPAAPAPVELDPPSPAPAVEQPPAPAAKEPERFALSCLFHGDYGWRTADQPDPGCPDCKAEADERDTFEPDPPVVVNTHAEMVADVARLTEPTPAPDPVLDATPAEIMAAQAEEAPAPQSETPAAEPEKPKRKRRTKAEKEAEEAAAAAEKAERERVLTEAKEKHRDARELARALMESGAGNSIPLWEVPSGCLVHVNGMDVRITGKSPATASSDDSEGHPDLVTVYDRDGKSMQLLGELTCRIVAIPGETPASFAPDPAAARDLEQPEAVEVREGERIDLTNHGPATVWMVDETGAIAETDDGDLVFVENATKATGPASTCPRCGEELGFPAPLCDACDDADQAAKEAARGSYGEAISTMERNVAELGEDLGKAVNREALVQALQDPGVREAISAAVEVPALDELTELLSRRKQLARELARVDARARAILDTKAAAVMQGYAAIGVELDLVPAGITRQLDGLGHA